MREDVSLCLTFWNYRENLTNRFLTEFILMLIVFFIKLITEFTDIRVSLMFSVLSIETVKEISLQQNENMLEFSKDRIRFFILDDTFE